MKKKERLFNEKITAFVIIIIIIIIIMIIIIPMLE